MRKKKRDTEIREGDSRHINKISYLHDLGVSQKGEDQCKERQKERKKKRKRLVMWTYLDISDSQSNQHNLIAH